jgi:hypothetical protein
MFSVVELLRLGSNPSLRIDLPRKTSSIPANTPNDPNVAKLGNDFGFTVRVNARSGTPPSSGWRCLACLAGKCHPQDHRSLIGDTPDTRRTLAGPSP